MLWDTQTAQRIYWAVAMPILERFLSLRGTSYLKLLKASDSSS